MLVKRTSKNQFTLPKAVLREAGIGDKDEYFDARYDETKHAIYLKPVKLVVEEKLSEKALHDFEEKALSIENGDREFQSRKEADRFLRGKLRK